MIIYFGKSKLLFSILWFYNQVYFKGVAQYSFQKVNVTC